MSKARRDKRYGRYKRACVKKPNGSRWRRPKYVNGRLKRYPPLPKFSYAKLLKKFFIPVLNDARRNSSVLWSLFKKPRAVVEGDPIVLPVRFGRADLKGNVCHGFPGNYEKAPGSQPGASTD